MVKDILGEVIEVEKEIRKRLEIEEIKSQEWLDKVKREAEDEIVREEARLKETIGRAVEEARADAERKASEIIGSAAAHAERLHEVRDDSLREILSKHLVRILPG